MNRRGLAVTVLPVSFMVGVVVAAGLLWPTGLPTWLAFLVGAAAGVVAAVIQWHLSAKEGRHE